MKVFEEFPILETERLILRKLKARDNRKIVSIFSNEETVQFMDIDAIYTAQEAEQIIKWCNKLFTKNQGIRWGIERKEDGLLIGTCGFNNWIKERANRAEIGYDLGKNHFRKGYMSEALTAMLNYGFNTMEIHRIEAMVDPQNKPSRKLLEKLGFQNEGILRDRHYWKGKYQTEVIYAILDHEWDKGSGRKKKEEK